MASETGEEFMSEKVIALDIGGVCLNIRYDLCCKYFGFNGMSEVPERFQRAIEKLECGLIEDREWLAEFRMATGGKFTDAEMIDGWNVIIGGDMTGMPELKLSFIKLVDGGVFSFNVKARKPDMAMYDAFETQHGKPYFYVDDRPVNIQAGIHQGWNSHQFISAAAMRHALLG